MSLNITYNNKQIREALEDTSSVVDLGFISNTLQNQNNLLFSPQSVFDSYCTLNVNPLFNRNSLVNDLKSFFQSIEVYNDILQYFMPQVNSDEQIDIDYFFGESYLPSIYEYEIEEGDYLDYDSLLTTLFTYKVEIKKYLFQKRKQRYLKATILHEIELKLQFPSFFEIPIVFDLLEYLDNIINIKKVLLEKQTNDVIFSFNNTFNIYSNGHKTQNRSSMFFSCN